MIFNDPKRLMKFMSLLMYRTTTDCGIPRSLQKLLWMLYKGHYTLSGLTNVLSRSEKQIRQDKGRILMTLEMRNRLYELLNGTRFCPDMQRTAFISPADVETVS